jgi:hypothetical protein
VGHLFQGVQILQQTALDKLAAKKKYVRSPTSAVDGLNTGTGSNNRSKSLAEKIRVVDPDPDWIRIQCLFWNFSESGFRIRIQRGKN